MVKLDNDASWELYHLSDDRTETTDLADTYPHKVNELQKDWDQLANEYNVYPAPN